MLAFAILGALVHRLRTGEGQKVDVSLYGSQIAIQSIHASRAWNEHGLEPPGRSSGVLSHRSLCLDGAWIAFGFLEAHHFPKLAHVLELEDLLADPRFATPAERGPNHGALVELLDAQIIQRPSSEWIERLRAADVPCTVVQDYDAIRRDPQAIANGYVHEEEHPKWGSIATQGLAATYSRSPAAVYRHAPITPGDDTHQILSEGGFSEDEIKALAAAGVVLRAVQASA